MSYDLGLVDENGEWIELDDKHQMRGGTYCLGGCDTAELNITYNYSSFFHEALDKEKGIRVLYGMTGKESIPLLKEAWNKLRGPSSGDYWESCPGNARRALGHCLELAEMCPEGVWQGD